MNLRTKVVFLVGLISYLSANSESMSRLDKMVSSFVTVRDSNGNLTNQGKMFHSLVFMMITHIVMSY